MASKLSQIQARFQQKQMQEKEEKLLRMYENQQQRAIERVNRGSAESSNSPTSNNSITVGKVRQMFDERRQKAGIDRSYPLEPLRVTKSNGYNGINNYDSSKTVIKTTTVKKQVTQIKNGKPIVNKREIVHSVYNNNDGDENYEEHVVKDNNLNRPILNRTYKRRDLEMMMREHSRNENIDDEEFPDVNIEQFEDPLPKPQLSNTNRVSPMGPVVLNKDIGKTKTVVRSETAEKPPSSHREVKRSDKNQTKNPTKELRQISSLHTTWNRNQTVLTSSGTSIKTSTCKEPSLTKGSIKNKHCIKNPFPKKIVKTTSKSSVTKETSPSPKTFTPPSPSRQINRSSPVAMSSKSPAKNQVDSARAQTSSRPPSKQNPRAASNVARDDLQACQYCNRRFAEDRLATHEDICAKTGKKKRKVYDATKHRVVGTELEAYTRKPNKSLQQKKLNLSNSKSKQQNQPQPAPVKKTNWRKKHEEFIGAIRAAKMAQAHVAKGGKLSDLPPPPPSENPDYVQCPHCGRKFNQSAAERHIPKCATYEFNKRKGGGRK